MINWCPKIAFFICLWASFVGASQPAFDLKLLTTIGQGSAPNFDKAMQWSSHTVYPIMLATPATMLLVGHFKHDKDLTQNGWRSAIGIGSTLVLTYAIKESVRRKRPFQQHPDLFSGTADALSYSMPSGHSSSAFATATSLSIAFPKWYVIVPAYAWAGTLAYSRLRLGVHYPTDVFAGALLGIGTTWLTFEIDKRWRQKQKSVLITPRF